MDRRRQESLLSAKGKRLWKPPQQHRVSDYTVMMDLNPPSIRKGLLLTKMDCRCRSSPSHASPFTALVRLTQAQSGASGRRRSNGRCRTKCKNYQQKAWVSTTGPNSPEQRGTRVCQICTSQMCLRAPKEEVVCYGIRRLQSDRNRDSVPSHMLPIEFSHPSSW
jgi:hypothetical protein